MRDDECMLTGKDVLHFAPERCIEDVARRTAKTYITADLAPRQSGAGEAVLSRHRLDVALDIANLGLSNDVFDIVVCNQVLDQVPNDEVALRELVRILRPQGMALITVPIVEGWENTFEDPNIRSAHDRLKYFGFEDRVHYYGRDFNTRVRNAGFAIEIFQPQFHAYAEYGLIPGDKILIGLKQ
jgi:SAM-dependent methyltransferase